MHQNDSLSQEIRGILLANCTTFDKLTGDREPYLFERIAVDTKGMECVYYSFHLRDGKPVEKRIPLKELIAALRVLTDQGSMTRADFDAVCPIAQSAGPCGFAVTGRILEYLGVARYAGRGEGFHLVDRDRAGEFLK